MAEWNRDRINPSLLDRLTDEAPGAAGGRGAFSSLSELRRSVLRDLTWLFNTTQLFDAESAEAWPQVRKSVLNYGLPALSGRLVSGLDLTELERAMHAAILAFEPRILPGTLLVTSIPPADPLRHHNVITMQISGQLWAQPYPLELLIKTDLNLESGEVRLAESS